MSLTNEETCKLFASKARAIAPIIAGGKYDYQPWTRRSGNGTIYFNGNRLYSYGDHFCIAELDPETGTAYVTLRKYSVTTSRHTSTAYMALYRAGWNIVREPSLDGVTRRGM